MKGMKKKGNGAVEPVLDLPFIVEAEKYQLDVRVLEQLERYPVYYQMTKGRKPTKDQVVNGALEKLFKEDSGFQDFLVADNRQSATVGGKQGANPTATHSSKKESESLSQVT